MPIIDLTFQLKGSKIPIDHGYILFAALCRIVPYLHGETRIGIHPIRGVRTEPGLLELTEHSRLRLRLPSEEAVSYIALGGQTLDLAGHLLKIEYPRAESLVPAANLASRLVTFRNALTSSDLEAQTREQLAELKIAAPPSLVPSARPPWVGQPIRRVLCISGQQVVGFALRVSGLTAEESIRLQEHGLGGRRRMGCGLFTPNPGRSS